MAIKMYSFVFCLAKMFDYHCNQNMIKYQTNLDLFANCKLSRVNSRTRGVGLGRGKERYIMEHGVGFGTIISSEPPWREATKSAPGTTNATNLTRYWDPSQDESDRN